MRFAALLSVAAALCGLHRATAFSAKSRSNAVRGAQGTWPSLPAVAKESHNNDDDVAAVSDGTRRLLFAAGGLAAAAVLGPPNSNVALAASGPYAPAPGSMENKVVVITGGNTGKLKCMRMDGLCCYIHICL